MRTVAVVGGGIAGLVAARDLARRGARVELYESSTRVGGMIGSFRESGFLVERGPAALLLTTPRIDALISSLELDSRIVRPLSDASRRYLVRNEKLEPVPGSVWQMCRTPLLSARGKLRALGEPFVKRAPDGMDEALAAFVARRLGPEVLDYFINPLVGGIYAGDPARLSVRHAFPRLHKLEQTYGSLIRGAVLGARDRAKSDERSRFSAEQISFDDGMQVLVDALAEPIMNRVSFRMPACEVTSCEGGYEIAFANGSTRRHSAVLLCAPAHQLARMSFDSRDRLSALERIPYPPVAKVTFGFGREQVRHSLDGFGVLIPERENFHSLGILFGSSVFPGRAPEGCVSISVFVGGARQPNLCAKEEAHLRQFALADARRLLGISGEPLFEHLSLIRQSIPQYETGYAVMEDAMGALERRMPGVFLAGNYRHGISVTDTISSALEAAAKVSEFLENANTRHTAYQHGIA